MSQFLAELLRPWRDGLAILRLRQMHQPSRKRLIGLAMTAARAELAVDAVAAPEDLCRGPVGQGPVPDPARLPRERLGRGVCYAVSYFSWQR